MTVSELALYFPSTTQGVKTSLVILMSGYMILRRIVAFCRKSSTRISVRQLSDAAAFTGSVLIGMGLMHAPTMAAIGDTTIFLIIGAIGTCIYSIEELFAECKK